MNSDALKFERLEATLERLQKRFPDLPVGSVLLSRLLLHLGRGVCALLDREIRPFGLTEVEFRVLTTLYSLQDGSACPSELCTHTALSPANMSRISDALAGRDLITRISSLHDRRKMVLRMTLQGEDLVRRLLPTLYGPLRALFDEFREEDQRQLTGQLKRLVAKLDEAMVEHAAERPG